METGRETVETAPDHSHEKAYDIKDAMPPVETKPTGADWEAEDPCSLPSSVVSCALSHRFP